MPLPRTVVALLLSLILAACARLAAAQEGTTCGDVGGAANIELFVPYSFNLLRAKHGVPPLQWSGGFNGQNQDWLNINKAAGCAAQKALDGGCQRVAAGDMPSTCRSQSCAADVAEVCDPAWSCPVDAARCPIITWTCKPADCPGATCSTAISQWTSYKWVNSDTPLDDNPQGLDYAQIVWATATSVTCVQKQQWHCKAVACIFDKAIELTNEAFKANVKPLVAADKYDWCKFAKVQKQCNDEHLKCDGGSVSDCCQTTCTFTAPPDPSKPDKPDKFPWCSFTDIAITKELCKVQELEYNRNVPISECCPTACAA